MALVRLEPLMVARPSRASRPGTGMPARSSARAAGIRSPSRKASPSPIISSAIWLIGARSPHAPTEPFSHTTGVTPRLSISTSVCGDLGAARRVAAWRGR